MFYDSGSRKNHTSKVNEAEVKSEFFCYVFEYFTSLSQLFFGRLMKLVIFFFFKADGIFFIGNFTGSKIIFDFVWVDVASTVWVYRMKEF